MCKGGGSEGYSAAGFRLNNESLTGSKAGQGGGEGVCVCVCVCVCGKRLPQGQASACDRGEFPYSHTFRGCVCACDEISCRRKVFFSNRSVCVCVCVCVCVRGE